PLRIIANQSLAVDVVSGATITSRAILRAAELALAEAGGDITSLKQAVAKPALKKGPAEIVDIVIVGGGLAGINAAYDLKIKAPTVSYVVLEQLDVITGSLPMAGGAIIATKSKLHSSLGLESSLSDIIQLMEVASKGRVRNNYISQIYANSEELLNRLLDWGAPLYSVPNYRNTSTNNVNTTLSQGTSNDKVYAAWANNGGAGFARFYNDHLAQDPLNLRLRSKVTELIVSGGRVTGVKVRDDEKEYEIYAKAVLLATGGFGMNQELIREYSPLYLGGISRTNAGATGDGFILTRQFNPEIVGWGMMGGNIRASLKLNAIASMFVVSTEGRRIANEADNYAVLEALKGGEVTGYKLLDSNFSDQNVLKIHLDAGLIEPYDTLEALARAKGINEANLLATVRSYNQAIDTRQSPGFGLPAERGQKIDTPPYYAERLYTNWFGTVAGIKVDDQMHVLDGTDRPVPGLYAAGELTEGNMWWGTLYPGAGVGISYATYTGPYAVRNIVAELK
ncbi:MAG: FAD-dependent oxidoreductase, partial [Spirochaetaceae bacterium]|nr:FAD-dependent oxidoreductase [Spirochaetaceae bacterium]